VSKYGAIKTVIDGFTFDSKAEARRYTDLLILQRAGKIHNLELQPVFELAPKVKIAGESRTRPALRFTADFAYDEDGQQVVEDVKGVVTQAFRIRQHLMKTVHGIDVRVVA